MDSILELKVGKALIFVAHPDDEIIGFGSGIHKLKRKKDTEIVVYTMTSGGNAAQSKEKSEEMILKRRKEAIKADKILGVDKRVFMGYESQTLYPPRQELHHSIIKIIREEKPDLVLTHFVDFHHFDHQSLHEQLPWSVTQAGEELLENDLGKKHVTAAIFYFPVGIGLTQITHPLKIIEEDLNAQIEALRTQHSQKRDGQYLEWWEATIRSRANQIRAPRGYPLIQQLQICSSHPALVD